MGHALAVFASGAHPRRETGKAGGGFLGDGLEGFARLEFFRIGEDPAQHLALLRIDQIVNADFAGFVRIAGERGVDDDAFAVGDHQQRRVIQVQRVIEQLLEGCIQVLAGRFVFPAETIALPDIGPAIAAARLFRAPLETVMVRVAGLGNTKQITEIIKMRLCPGAFGEGVILPGGNEFFRSHGGLQCFMA
jgi:hypothetical protein